MFKELIDDPFYNEYRKYKESNYLNDKYGISLVDYFILEPEEYKGEETHREAVLFAIEEIHKRRREYCSQHNITYIEGKSEDRKKLIEETEKERSDGHTYYFDLMDEEKLKKITKIDPNVFFEVPKEYEMRRKELEGGKHEWRIDNIAGEYINYNTFSKPYWYLFLHPPNPNMYKLDDFIKINNILFPNGKDNLEIYDWSVDWSDYFCTDPDWSWGARCTSIYDKSLNRFVVIMASSAED